MQLVLHVARRDADRHGGDGESIRAMAAAALLRAGEIEVVVARAGPAGPRSRRRGTRPPADRACAGAAGCGRRGGRRARGSSAPAAAWRAAPAAGARPARRRAARPRAARRQSSSTAHADMIGQAVAPARGRLHEQVVGRVAREPQLHRAARRPVGWIRRGARGWGWAAICPARDRRRSIPRSCRADRGRRPPPARAAAGRAPPAAPRGSLSSSQPTSMASSAVMRLKGRRGVEHLVVVVLARRLGAGVAVGADHVTPLGRRVRGRRRAAAPPASTRSGLGV